MKNVELKEEIKFKEKWKSEKEIKDRYCFAFLYRQRLSWVKLSALFSWIQTYLNHDKRVSLSSFTGDE